MADLVIDEWLWSDLTGENTKAGQREAFQFLEAIYNKCDRIVTVRGSRFDQKSLGLFKLNDIIGDLILKFFKDRFWFNSVKTVLLEEDQLPDLPEHLYKEVEPSDQYLVRAFIASGASEIVTTDNPLKDALTRHGIDCKHRCEFVPAYIAQYGP